MAIYIVYILLCLVGICCWDSQEQKSNIAKVCYVFLGTYLILLSGLSYALGGDKQLYIDLFEDYLPQMTLGDFIVDNFVSMGYMPLWSIVNYACKQWFDSFYALQIIQSVVVNGIICYIGFKYTKRHFLFLLIYFISKQFFLFNCETMREGFAVALGLLALDNYFRQKNISAFILAGIAVGFHPSATILFAFPFMHLNINFKTLTVLLAIALLAFSIRATIVPVILQKLPIEANKIATNLETYLTFKYTFHNTCVFAIHYIVIPFIIGYCILLWGEDFPIHSYVQPLVTFMLIIGCLACVLGAHFTRLNNYVIIFYLILIVEFIPLLFTQQQFLITRCLTLLCLCYFVFCTYNMQFKSSNLRSYQLYYPYTSIFDEKSCQEIVISRQEYHEASLMEFEEQK